MIPAVCFTAAGVLGGIPVLTAAAWLMHRGKRNVDAVEAGDAEFVNSSGL